MALTLLLVAAPAVADQVKTDAGIVAGFTAPGSSVRVFRGIPCLVHRLVGRLLAHADKS